MGLNWQGWEEFSHPDKQIPAFLKKGGGGTILAHNLNRIFN